MSVSEIDRSARSSTPASANGTGSLSSRSRKAELANILCADDDADIRAVVELALASVGRMQVSMCSSGEACLEVLERQLPDLVVLDVNMPGLGGVDTLRKIRADARTAALPVVMLTARLSAHDIDSYRAAGASGVIAKPFDPMELAGQLRQLYRSLA